MLYNLECLEEVCICLCFYCLFYVEDMSTDISEEQVSEDRDPDLNEEEDIIMEYSRDEHWSDVAEYGDNKKKIHVLT